jgi:LmbE family N-acetylglucosaminyl deacetylase
MTSLIPSSMHWIAAATLAITALGATFAQRPTPPDDGRLRIIAFGAHPDDCELQVGGVAAMWAAKGHHVKLVSVTNGDIGHWREAGGPLALRRKAEVEAASKILGSTVEVLDNHDGELMPTLENRRALIRLIREWKADVVLAPRSNDYHPDHRYTAILVQDAAFMVTVPFICPETPPLKQNPVFLYYTDRFQKPNPSAPDIIIGIDGVMDKKLDALAVMESQFLEGGANGHEGLMPKTSDERRKRVADVRAAHAARNVAIADRFRSLANEWYGPQRGATVKYAEAFEICEYGRRPDRAELKRLFPFFD